MCASCALVSAALLEVLFGQAKAAYAGARCVSQAHTMMATPVLFTPEALRFKFCPSANWLLLHSGMGEKMKESKLPITSSGGLTVVVCFPLQTQVENRFVV